MTETSNRFTESEVESILLLWLKDKGMNIGQYVNPGYLTARSVAELSLRSDQKGVDLVAFHEEPFERWVIEVKGEDPNAESPSTTLNVMEGVAQLVVLRQTELPPDTRWFIAFPACKSSDNVKRKLIGSAGIRRAGIGCLLVHRDGSVDQISHAHSSSP